MIRSFAKVRISVSYKIIKAIDTFLYELIDSLLQFSA